jgi:hypothetical protein
MKKKFLVGALLSILICSYGFGKEKTNGISEKVKAAFQHDFVNATEVQWEDGKQYIKASFKIGSQTLFAYFDPAGVLLAIIRNISSDQLPIRLQILLKTKYSKYWITDLFEINEGGDSSYFITLNNGDREIVLKSERSCNWRAYSPAIDQTTMF